MTPPASHPLPPYQQYQQYQQVPGNNCLVRGQHATHKSQQDATPGREEDRRRGSSAQGGVN